MKTIKFPGMPGGAIHIGSDEGAERMQNLVNKRHAFSVEYARSKGWGDSLDKLTIDQILEIRQQPGWKSPE